MQREASFCELRPFLHGLQRRRASKLRFSPSLVRAVANAAMGREDVLPFWFGESDQPTPAFIREAAIASLR
jgi:aspartate/methionine/tyrosine aminotransferase